MSHDRSPISSFSPSSLFGHVPEGGPVLPAGHIHVWRAIVDVPVAGLQVYQEALSPDERNRAQRLTLPRHQQRFTAARGILRHILARYLRTPPQDIRFQSGPFGKPLLQHRAGHPLHFNVSHSQQSAVYAVSRNLEVGIDLEEDRDSLDFTGLAERICSPEEFMVFQKLRQAERQAAFFRCWTRKEAFVKAIGKGLSCPLNTVTVSFTPDEPPRILDVDGQSPDEWSLFDLPLAPGFWGALAVAGKPSHLQGWDYLPED